ncbi:sulfonate ABC transporter ATP-binding protein (plasmid) [Leptolyngbya sp. BL0902]|uniref:ABC transporter ATP-binding protein n=1 Tax=Leptolyngbya sp. BL0902 TaxID=1115757 RepID=UPI0019353230|nr:ABC transporter ATP-binding protein [Leptolyngbya sp. BL0902]QQE67634.1 sulfonate ABC transporter ATP-binding protein [Leptolyngbya sp. BL0902]
MVTMQQIEQEQRATLKGSVQVEGLSVVYRRKQYENCVLDSIQLSIQPGEFVCLLGPSGCGKSTLLNVIAGFIKPSSGYALVDHMPITRPGADRGFVFQQYSLLPWKTTFQNVEMGLRIQGVSKAERTERVNDYLNRVGLYKHRNSYPHQLSGGMQQRASIIRALVNSPSVLLMDEPFAALDAQTRHMMQELLLSIWDDLKTTVIFVTHDIEEAIFLGDRICTMGVHPGRIKSEIPVHLPRPRHFDDTLSQDFIDLHRRVFECIREETMKSMEA